MHSDCILCGSLCKAKEPVKENKPSLPTRICSLKSLPTTRVQHSQSSSPSHFQLNPMPFNCGHNIWLENASGFSDSTKISALTILGVTMETLCNQHIRCQTPYQALQRKEITTHNGYREEFVQCLSQQSSSD